MRLDAETTHVLDEIAAVAGPLDYYIKKTLVQASVRGRDLTTPQRDAARLLAAAVRLAAMVEARGLRPSQTTR